MSNHSSGTLDNRCPADTGAPAPPSIDRSVPELLAAGLRSYRSGSLAEARRLCTLALGAEPDQADAFHLLGLVSRAEGDADKAVALIAEAIRRAPGNAEYYNNLGVILRDRKALVQAAACHRRALELNPCMAVAADNLSAVSRAMGQFAEAVVHARRAIALDPENPAPWFNLALAFHAQGRLREAVGGYRELIRRQPDHAPGHFNQGVALFDLGGVEEAAAAYIRALSIRPDYPEALNGLSVIRRIQGRYDEALALCRKALDLRPDFPEAVSHLAVLCRITCNWVELAPLTERLSDMTAASLASGAKTAEQPMFSLWSDRPPETRLAIARSWAASLAPSGRAPAASFSSPHRAPSHGALALRIGYLSSDFRNHPVGHQIIGVLRAHDRKQFSIGVYSIGPDDGSAYRREAAAYCDRFVDLNGLPDEAAAERIAADGIDILVDLNGHTAGNRMAILARRPAPIQASYLGFPGTTGSDFHDYLITDRVVTPPDQQDRYSEIFAYLPHCYMATDNTQPVSPAGFQRSQFGLREDWVVFCSFNNFWKIDPATFSVWAGILQEIPESCLWLPGGNAPAAANLRQAAEGLGVSADRLVFAEKLKSKADHLGRLALADLALDTCGYNGHVSTCDALWAGVPVLACLGAQFPGRASASMLIHAGLPELVCASLAEYEAAALRLGRCPDELRELKARLKANRDVCALFDTRRFTTGLEQVYTAMATVHRSGKPHRRIEIHAEMDPGYAQAHCNAGRLLFGSERWEEARARFQQAVAADPGHAAAWHGLGLCFQKMLDLDSAGRCYEKALALKPDYHAAAIDMGNVCLDRGDFSGMADWYRRALDFTSADAADFLNVGRMYQDQGRLDDALECIEAALGRDPESVAAHFSRAAILLAQGEWTRGWKEYEWRFRRTDRQNAYPHRLPAPRWDGRSFEGRTLLVHCEQGLGDSIQFARYLPRVKDRGGTVLFEMPAALKPLFENLPGMDEALVFSPAAMTTRRFDLQVPLLSLPGIFNSTMEDLPGAVPYLKADPGRTAAWAPRLSAGRLKVGIVWAASGWNQALARKSCRLSDFLPLAALPGVRLYGMQKGPAANEAAEVPDGIAFANLGEQFADFADTAAAIANLDLVISVDTAAAHLAGAMGKPVWVLLPSSSDWRWLLNRDDSPWYPTMRLFRQQKGGDWQGVFMQVSDRLMRRIGWR